MIQKMLLFLNFGNSLIKRNLYLLHGMGNQYQFIFPAVTALSISGLVCLLAFSMYAWKIRSGSIFLLLLLSLMVRVRGLSAHVAVPGHLSGMVL